jgi:quinol monooxygenase YgiN
MISFTVRMTFRPDDRETVAGHLRTLTAESRKEPGCVSYIPHTVDGNPDTVLIYEQYVDEAAVEHHRGTPHFAQHAVAGFYQVMLDRQVESLVALA